MSRISRPFFVFAALLTLLVWPLHETDARGARGGGFGGSRGSSMRSSRPVFSGGGEQRRNTSQRSADSTLATKVNRSGSSQSRGEAMDARQSTSPGTSSGAGNVRTSAGGWRTSGGTTAIPQSVRRPDGGTSPVYLDQSRGGNGFFDSAGKWILISSLMNGGGNFGGYQPHYAQPANSAAASEGSADSTSRPRRGGGGGVFVIIGLIVLLVLVAGGLYLFQLSRASRPGRKTDAVNAALGHKASAEPAAPRTVLDPWLALEPGSFITLSDQQAIEDSQKRGGGVRGIDYTVESVGIAKDFDGFATWVLAMMSDGHQRLLFMVKGDETHMEHRVYHPSEDFHPARRETVIARGDRWLFEGSPSSENPDMSKLRYAAEIPYSAAGADLLYARKDHGERHCDYSEKPVLSGFGSQIATVAEYRTSDPTDNPELLILEIAASKSKTGEVSIYFGTPVRSSEVDIVRTSAVG